MSEILDSLQTSSVVLDGSGHDVLRATGNDRVSFLQRITTGKLASLEAGQGGRTLLLDVRGRVLASLLAFVRGSSVRVIVAHGQGTGVVAGLSKFAIMDDFLIAPEADLATLAVLGPKANQALGEVGIEVPQALVQAPLFAHAEVVSAAFGPLWIARGRACGSDGLCVVATTSARQALADALAAKGTPKLAPEVAEGLRIAALEPAPGKEISPDYFPVEVGLGAAIDHSKGCYVGQETIVRMRDRGNVRKRLVLLRMEGDDLPSPGDKISAETKPDAGQITSAGRLPGQAPIALAVVAKVVPVGAAVKLQHAEATLSATIVSESQPWG